MVRSLNLWPANASSLQHLRQAILGENSMRFAFGATPFLRPKFQGLLRAALVVVVPAALLMLPQQVVAQTRRSPSGVGSSSSATDQAGKGSISGYVTDSAGGVLQGAAISVQPGGFSAVSNTQGQFTISDLVAGEYTVTVTYSGFAPFNTTIKLAADQKASVQVSLQVAAANQSVLVHGDLQGEAEEIQIQRTSENIVNVMSADVIKSLPNANVADAVGRLPVFPWNVTKAKGSTCRFVERSRVLQTSRSMASMCRRPKPRSGR